MQQKKIRIAYTKENDNMKIREELNNKSAERSDDEWNNVTGGIEWFKEESSKTQAWFGIENDRSLGSREHQDFLETVSEAEWV